MEAFSFPVSMECERASKRQCTSHERVKQSLGELVKCLDGLKERAENAQADRAEVEGAGISLGGLMREAVEAVEKSQKKIVTEQKEIYRSLTNLSKAVDRTSMAGLEKYCYPTVSLDKKQISEAISGHLFRQGAQSIAETFAQEAEIDLESCPPDLFRQMNEIIDALAERNVEPAIQFVMSRREQLQSRGSSLEFACRRLVYLSRVEAGNWLSALAYAREHFHHFMDTQMPKIQQLMGCLMYTDNLESSPYADLFKSSEWTEVALMFTKDCLNLHNLPWESPLKSLMNTASKTLPSLLKTRKVLKGKKDWIENGDLTLEVDLGHDSQYHSVFTCPVIRSEATEENPPMMLPCGHVLCMETLAKLPKHDGRVPCTVWFKCPYCPGSAYPSECRRIHF